MSNPTLLVSQFADSLAYDDQSGAGVWTDVEPIRYADGLWLEKGTTNYVANPLAVVDTADWSTAADGVISVETLPAAIPDEYGLADVENCFAFTASGNVVGGFAILAFNLGFTLTAAVHTQSWLIYVPTAFSGTELKTYDAGLDVGASRTSTGDVDMGLRDQWQRVAGVFTPGSGDLTGNLLLVLLAGTMLAGEVIYFVGVQTEAGAYPTSICPEVDGAGDPLDGYAFTGTPHQSSSTRAASSVSVATANHIGPLAGSLAFRFTRKQDTGSLEPILEVGENTAGYDHLQMYIDSDTLWVAWDSEGALPQTIDTGHTITVDQEYFIYTYWDGLVFGVSIDNGTPVIANRDVPTGDWGTNPLTLEAA